MTVSAAYICDITATTTTTQLVALTVYPPGLSPQQILSLTLYAPSLSAQQALVLSTICPPDLSFPLNLASMNAAFACMRPASPPTVRDCCAREEKRLHGTRKTDEAANLTATTVTTLACLSLLLLARHIANSPCDSLST